MSQDYWQEDWRALLRLKYLQKSREDGGKGFRSKRRCSDQWLVLKRVCYIRKGEKKKSSYLALQDISKV